MNAQTTHRSTTTASRVKRKPGLMRLHPLAVALVACGIQCAALAGPNNVVPTPPTPVRPSTTQYGAVTPSAGCGGQYSNAINSATKTGLDLQIAGVTANVAGVAAQGAGVVTQGLGVAAQGVGLVASAVAVAAQTAGAVFLVADALIPGLIAEEIAIYAQGAGRRPARCRSATPSSQARCR